MKSTLGQVHACKFTIPNEGSHGSHIEKEKFLTELDCPSQYS